MDGICKLFFQNKPIYPIVAGNSGKPFSVFLAFTLFSCKVFNAARFRKIDRSSEFSYLLSDHRQTESSFVSGE
jgi:hypothetical protein